MNVAFLGFISCTSTQIDSSVETTIPEDSGLHTIDDNTPHRFVLSSMLYLNRSGKLFLFDQNTEEVVWELQNPDDPVWLDAYISSDGTTIYHNVVDVKGHDSEKSEIRTIAPSGEIIDSIPTPGAHHSFVLYDNGFATITTEFRTHPAYGKVAGDRITFHSDGPTTTILSSFSVLDPAPLTTMWDFGHFEDAKDWTHANALRWYPQQDRFVLCLPGINAIWLFDSTGTMKAVYLGLGMEAEPYTQGIAYQNEPYPIYEGGTFDMPHGASMDTNGVVWVLSNGLGGQTISYAQGYAIENNSLVLKENIPARNPNAHSAGLGSVIHDRDGSLIINWGIYGQIDKRSPQREEQWLLESNLQEVYGFSSLFDEWNP